MQDYDLYIGSRTQVHGVYVCDLRLNNTICILATVGAEALRALWLTFTLIKPLLLASINAFCRSNVCTQIPNILQHAHSTLLFISLHIHSINTCIFLSQNYININLDDVINMHVTSYSLRITWDYSSGTEEVFKKGITCRFI